MKLSAYAQQKIAVLKEAIERIETEKESYICFALNPNRSGGMRYELGEYIQRSMYHPKYGFISTLERWLLDNQHITYEQFRTFVRAKRAVWSCQRGKQHPDMKAYRLRWLNHMIGMVERGEL